MMFKILFTVAAVAQVASAHFRVTYPTWRGDSFATGYSQWNYPCAGYNATTDTNNRTLWPLDGGAAVLNSSHPWVYVFINLGLGTNPTNFNISLTPNLLNITGAGQTCFPKLKLPAGLNLTEGQEASIQFVTHSDSGNALYNCADIKFSKNATAFPASSCTNATGQTAAILAGNGQSVQLFSNNGSATSSNSSGSGTSSGSGASTTSKAAAAILGYNAAALVAPAVGAVAFALL